MKLYLALLALAVVLADTADDDDDNNGIDAVNTVRETNTNGGVGTLVLTSVNNGVKTTLVKATRGGEAIRVVNGKLVRAQRVGEEEQNEASGQDDVVRTKSESEKDEVNLDDPLTINTQGIDGRKEIAKFNDFMSEIFRRMNAAIKVKRLDPMNLKLLPSDRAKDRTRAGAAASGAGGTHHVLTTDRPIYGTSFVTDDSFLILTTGGTTTTTTSTTTTTTTTTTRPETRPPRPDTAPALAGSDDDMAAQVSKVRGWLYGMSTLKRNGDVSIVFRKNYRVIECPFSLGPLQLKISKTVGRGKDKKTKSATATTEQMLGLMDLKIDVRTGRAEIVDVVFDRPGGVSVDGSFKRKRVEEDEEGGDGTTLPPRFRLVLAQRAAESLKKVARLITSHPIETQTKGGRQ